jgi:hypothetical protein
MHHAAPVKRGWHRLMQDGQQSTPTGALWRCWRSWAGGWAWIQGHQQHEASRQRHGPLRRSDGDGARLERLAQRIERIGPKVKRLVQEEDAAVRQDPISALESTPGPSGDG